MKKLVPIALLTAIAAPALLVPATAIAQSQAELRGDRRDIRDAERDLRRAERTGDPRRIHQERRDLRDAHREYREDLRDRDRRWADNDWRSWRDHNRALYARGEWRAPFRYNRFQPGARIGTAYYGPRYLIGDPWRYHLPQPGLGRAWVRHYNDVLLVDTRRGAVIRVLPGFYR
ncbi:RcnB family protein [Sphingomonas sp. R1]|uniref:RcnB family protein n=1 Tax=Sphingomonas sp. R1 TaxID=399176 RepID=UPI0022251CB8|nr:RcnB family protein [Sphingomonas sp. R1]UYY76042.1 RcnB family protein [Sphingomonas sp. R1]